MLDTSTIGDVVTDAMTQITDEFPEGRARSVALVVEVDDGTPITEWRVFGDDRPWMRRAVLELGLDQLDVEADEILREERRDD